jgi:hypothetical protein
MQWRNGTSVIKIERKNMEGRGKDHFVFGQGQVAGTADGEMNTRVF